MVTLTLKNQDKWNIFDRNCDEDLTKVITRRWSLKKFPENIEKFAEKYTWYIFFNEATSCRSANLTKKETLAQLLFWEFEKSKTFLFNDRNIIPVISNEQKQLTRGVLRKRHPENIYQIYRRTLMPECDFNKVIYEFIEITLRHGCSPVYFQHIFIWIPWDVSILGTHSFIPSLIYFSWLKEWRTISEMTIFRCQMPLKYELNFVVLANKLKS